MKEIAELVKKYWIGVILGVIALFIINHIYGTVCISKLLIGLPCPACGITRATFLLLTGHFYESWKMHPLLWLIIIGIIYSIFIKKILNKSILFIKIYVIITVVIFVGFYFYRITKCFPDVEPMVYWPDNCLHKMIDLFINRN